MAIKYNQHTLDKIIKVMEEAGYVVRFEKGTFNSGYCILEHKKVVVVNKFLDVEGRVTTLADILGVLTIHPQQLSPESKKLFTQLVPDTDVVSEHGSEEAEDSPANEPPTT